ncbi:MAG: DNA repair protein RecO [Bryobacteraceae bacterium]|jgi:DNA repair protein RecO (recombination protein O)|nr:DNA repair protein RecO [Bryobacteraceae bacterium]
MPVRVSEALTLRTYPFQEADLIVSFFTRDQGKLRGLARGARRPKSKFGAGLERLSYVRAYYFQRENRELVTLDACELIRSPFELQRDYAAAVALDFLAEVSEQLLAPAEPSERFFRLLLAVIENLQAEPAGLWRAITYFCLWAVRLSGFLPELPISPESAGIAEEMLQKPVGQLTPRTWTKQTAADLRRFLIRRIEEHIERNLVTVPLLEAL